MNFHSTRASTAAADARTLRVGIVETGSNGEEFVARHGTYVDWFKRWLGNASHGRFAFASFRACDGELPGAADACDAYVVTGSAASVTERLPWMKQAQTFLRTAAETRPVLGICFGHQLLADAYGGKVERAEKGWGIGVHTLTVHARKPWMTPGSDTVSVIASHMDQVTALPAEAELIAGSDFCPNGMLQIGANVLTFQNHPEVTKAFAHELYSSRIERVGEELTRTALASLGQGTHSNLFGIWATNFLVRGGKR